MAPKKSGKSSKALDKKSMKKTKGGAIYMNNMLGDGSVRTGITDGTSNTITGGTLTNKIVSP